MANLILLKENIYLLFSGLDPHGLYGSVTHDPLWTPSRKVDFSTPPPVTTAAGGTSVSVAAPVSSTGKDRSLSCSRANIVNANAIKHE